jgi:hypothetical protein
MGILKIKILKFLKKSKVRRARKIISTNSLSRRVYARGLSNENMLN